MSHYVARISIERVEKIITRSGGTITTPPAEKREVTEVANIVVRAATTEDLTKKLKAHLDLIDGE